MTKPYLTSKTHVSETLHDKTILGGSHIKLSRENKDRVLKHSNNNEEQSNDRKKGGHCKDSSTMNYDSGDDNVKLMQTQDQVAKDQKVIRRESEICSIYCDGLPATTMTPPVTNRTGTGRKPRSKMIITSHEGTRIGRGWRSVNKNYTPSSSQRDKKSHLVHCSNPHQRAKRERHRSTSESNVSHNNASRKSMEKNENNPQLRRHHEGVTFHLTKAMDDLTFGLLTLSALPCTGQYASMKV